MPILNLSADGDLTIPAELLKKLGLKPCGAVFLAVGERELVLRAAHEDSLRLRAVVPNAAAGSSLLPDHEADIESFEKVVARKNLETQMRFVRGGSDLSSPNCLPNGALPLLRMPCTCCHSAMRIVANRG